MSLPNRNVMIDQSVIVETEVLFAKRAIGLFNKPLINTVTMEAVHTGHNPQVVSNLIVL